MIFSCVSIGSGFEGVTPTEASRAVASREKEITLRVGKVSILVRRIPPGTFDLGSPAGDSVAEVYERPQRRVSISRSFYLGKFEVTQSQYREVVGDHRSRFEGDELPVDDVRYSDAIEFCRRLSKLVGLQVTLPTEAQWEYACRAGTTTRYYSGNEERDLERVAWYKKNSNGTTHKVGLKEANAFGLCDMLGNVDEPCIDTLPPYKSIKDTDPRGTCSNFRGSMRGGCWAVRAQFCRAAYKTRSNDDYGNMGIRIAINPDAENEGHEAKGEEGLKPKQEPKG
jgi:formylglycine-generating enzyme required for sulfatase activity